ncbi:MAG: class I SAM-dependent methyltransferase [Pseudobdellovibrionaceae bacterium]|jgi:SAM-dependent methyltransferase
MPQSQTRRRVHKIGKKKLFDKYELYQKAVQSAETDVEFLRKVYREIRKKDPQLLREDFCGTFALSCEWIKLNKNFSAIGVDLDPEPLEYGKAHGFKKLNESQQKRLRLIEQNVLKSGLPTADIAIAMNFSYFVFKSREIMKQYFQNVYKSLKKNGIFVVDCFGGSHCFEANEEKTNYKAFTYFWDQASYDPVTSRAQFYIHFKMKGQPKRERVFIYDWRMWSIPELREIMQEVGFKKTHVYWEGTTKKGEGDGVFTRTEKGEECQSWIAYIAAEK